MTEPASRPKSAIRRAPASERLLAGIAALCILSVFVISAWLSPSERGHGTHTGLGLPPCTWGSMTGYPCPTCGMTTSFAHVVRGQFVKGFTAQPFGALLAIAAATCFWIALHVAITGSYAWRIVGRMMGTPMLWVVLGMLLAAWGYKLLTWTGM